MYESNFHRLTLEQPTSTLHFNIFNQNARFQEREKTLEIFEQELRLLVLGAGRRFENDFLFVRSLGDDPGWQEVLEVSFLFLRYLRNAGEAARGFGMLFVCTTTHIVLAKWFIFIRLFSFNLSFRIFDSMSFTGKFKWKLHFLRQEQEFFPLNLELLNENENVLFQSSVLRRDREIENNFSWSSEKNSI